MANQTSRGEHCREREQSDFDNSVLEVPEHGPHDEQQADAARDDRRPVRLPRRAGRTW